MSQSRDPLQYTDLSACIYQECEARGMIFDIEEATGSMARHACHH